MGELVDEARLAHPRFANHRRHLTVTVARELLRATELLELCVAADEPGQSALSACLKTGPRRARPRHLIDLHGVGESLDRHEAKRLHLNVALRQRQRIGRDHDRAGIGDLLHARGQVSRLADRRVVHVEITADRAHDDLARVEPDPDLHDDAVTSEGLFCVTFHQVLHAERRVARPDGMVLVGQRRAEERHDPVAHDLVHGPLVAVDGLHHVFQDRVEEFARFLRVTVGQKLHRALEVGEKHRDLLALALEGSLRGENLLREVPWRV